MSAVRVGSLCCTGWLSVFLEVMQQKKTYYIKNTVKA